MFKNLSNWKNNWKFIIHSQKQKIFLIQLIKIVLVCMYVAQQFMENLILAMPDQQLYLMLFLDILHILDTKLGMLETLLMLVI